MVEFGAYRYDNATGSSHGKPDGIAFNAAQRCHPDKHYS